MKRFIFLGFVVLAIASTGCKPKAQAPTGGKSLTKAWETKAVFKNPESAVFDTERAIIYVSNVAGKTMEKNGQGFLSKLSLDGKVIELEWINGLNAPTGMTIRGDKLYVTDVDVLVEIDLKTDKILRRVEVPGARFLSDVSVSNTGIIYVSAMLTNAIYRMETDGIELYVKDDRLQNPNGVLGEGHRVVVGSWGTCDESFVTTTPGKLIAVNLLDDSFVDVAVGGPLGNLAGIKADGGLGYFVSDLKAGKIFHIDPDGKPITILTLAEGTADLEFIGRKQLLIIPMMTENKVLAYHVKSE